MRKKKEKINSRVLRSERFAKIREERQLAHLTLKHLREKKKNIRTIRNTNSLYACR